MAPTFGGNQQWLSWDTADLINKWQADKHPEMIPNFVEDGFWFANGGVGFNHYIMGGIVYFGGFRIRSSSDSYALGLAAGINWVFLKLNKVADPTHGYTSASNITIEVQVANFPTPPADPHILLFAIAMNGGANIIWMKEYGRHPQFPRDKGNMIDVPKYFNCFESGMETDLFRLFKGINTFEGWNFGLIDSVTPTAISHRRISANTLNPTYSRYSGILPCRSLRGMGVQINNGNSTGQYLSAAAPSTELELGATGIIMFSRFFLSTMGAAVKQQIVLKGRTGTNTCGYSLEYDAANNRFEFKIGTNGGAGWSNSVYFTWANSDLNRWYHVICGYDQPNDLVYISVNGAPYVTGAAGAPIGAVAGGAFYIGYDPDENQYGFLIIDEVTILKNPTTGIATSYPDIPLDFYNYGYGAKYYSPFDFGATQVYYDSIGDTVYTDLAVHTLLTRTIPIDRRSTVMVTSNLSFINSAATIREFNAQASIKANNGMQGVFTITAGDKSLVMIQHVLDSGIIPTGPDSYVVNTNVWKTAGTGNYTVRGTQKIEVIRGE